MALGYNPRWEGKRWSTPIKANETLGLGDKRLSVLTQLRKKVHITLQGLEGALWGLSGLEQIWLPRPGPM
jgi:hypothetical protein